MGAFETVDNIEGLSPCLGPGSLFAVGVGGRRIGDIANGEIFYDHILIPLEPADLEPDKVISMLDAGFERDFPIAGPDNILTAAAYIAKRCTYYEHDDKTTTDQYVTVPERIELISTIVVMDPHQRIVRIEEPDSAHAAPDGELLISNEVPDIFFPFAPPNDELTVIATAQSCRGGVMARLITAIQLEGTEIVRREALPDKALRTEETEVLE